MQTFEQWLWASRRVKMPKGDVDERWFINLDINMIVQCAYCGKNITAPHAFIDGEGYTCCRNCKEND